MSRHSMIPPLDDTLKVRSSEVRQFLVRFDLVVVASMDMEGGPTPPFGPQPMPRGVAGVLPQVHLFEQFRPLPHPPVGEVWIVDDGRVGSSRMPSHNILFSKRRFRPNTWHQAAQVMVVGHGVFREYRGSLWLGNRLSQLRVGVHPVPICTAKVSRGPDRRPLKV